MPLDEGTMYRIAPVVSITRLAEADLTFPEGEGNRFFLKVKTMTPISFMHMFLS